VSEKIRKFFSLLKKADKNKKAQFYLLLLFSLFFFATRLPRLNNDVINPDGVNWHQRSEQFVVGLKYFQLEKTYQHYHPGVTLMWVTGIPIEIFKQVTGIRVYDVSNFLSFHLVAKLSVVLFQFALSILIIFSLSKLTGFLKSISVVSLFTFEPFFLGNSRLYHLDVLVTLFIFLGLIYSYVNLKEPNFKNSVVAGFFLSMSFLTKSVAVGLLLFVVFYTGFYLIINKQGKKAFSTTIYLLLSFLFFTFLFFPALWKGLVYYISLIFKEAERVGIRKGHGQVILGEYTRDAGVLFYPLVLLVKVSPLVLIGALMGVYSYFRSFLSSKKFVEKMKNKLSNFGLYLSIFYLGYFLFMMYPTKKIDRYMIVIFPYIAYLAYMGYSGISNYLKNKNKNKYFSYVLTILVVVFWIVPFVKIYPYFFTYSSPLLINSVNANNFLAQKPFGVGTVELKETILERYWDKDDRHPSLGFYDTKPMKAIYPNSRVFDVRVYGTKNYDILVLGVNEEIPGKVKDSLSYYFEEDYTVWINGLEYWRIYLRKDLVGN